MRRGDCLSRFRCSEAILRRCWIRIGRLEEAGRGKYHADTRRNPFNDRVIASGSDDGKVFIWQVPQGFTLYSDAEEPEDIAPVSKLTGHSRYTSSSPTLEDNA
jgi:hypothetical protein